VVFHGCLHPCTQAVILARNETCLVGQVSVARQNLVEDQQAPHTLRPALHGSYNIV
jgi:hypothetical protein